MEVDLLGCDTESGIGIVVQVSAETILKCGGTIVLVGQCYLTFNFFREGSKGGMDNYRSDSVGNSVLDFVVGVGVTAKCVSDDGSVDGGARDRVGEFKLEGAAAASSEGGIVESEIRVDGGILQRVCLSL